MCVTVLVPITFPGSLISTRGSRAARAKRASDEIPSPGAMTPPRYSPFAEITSNVIAVPKSTTMHGPPHSAPPGHSPNNPRRNSPVFPLHLHQSFRPKPCRRTGVALGSVCYSHALAFRITRHRFEARNYTGHAFPHELIVIVLEFAQQPHQQFHARLPFARFRAQGTRYIGKLPGELFLIHVQPDSHNHKSHLIRFRVHLRQDASDFFPANKQVVRPL